MLTIAAYLVLNAYAPVDWSNWLLVLPVILDLVIIARLDK